MRTGSTLCLIIILACYFIAVSWERRGLQKRTIYCLSRDLKIPSPFKTQRVYMHGSGTCVWQFHSRNKTVNTCDKHREISCAVGCVWFAGGRILNPSKLSFPGLASSELRAWDEVIVAINNGQYKRKQWRSQKQKVDCNFKHQHRVNSESIRVLTDLERSTVKKNKKKRQINCGTMYYFFHLSQGCTSGPQSHACLYETKSSKTK